MPPKPDLFCKCTVNRCSDYTGGGRTLCAKTYKKHQLDERSANISTLYNQAQELSEKALRTQIEDVSAQLSASTLSDEVSGSSDIPGGRLWGKEPSSKDHREPTPDRSSSMIQPSLPRKSTPQCSTPPRRDQEDLVLEHLRDLDQAAETLLKKIASDVLSMKFPSAKNATTVFPLEAHFEALARFSDQLGMVSLKSLEVMNQLKSIEVKLEKSLAHLNNAKTAWGSKLKRLDAEKQSRGGVPFSTGLSPILYQLGSFD